MIHQRILLLLLRVLLLPVLLLLPLLGWLRQIPPSANLSIPTGPDHKTLADQSRGSGVPVRLGAPVQRADDRIS